METLSNIIPYFRKELTPIFEEREVISWAYLSIEHVLGYNRSDCIIHSNKRIEAKISDKFQQIIEDLKRQAQQIKEEKVKVINSQRYEEAANLRDKERKILSMVFITSRVLTNVWCVLVSPQF